LPRSADGQREGVPSVFLVVADESQQAEGEKLAQELRENGISVQGIDVISTAKYAQLVAPESLEIRFSEGTNDESVLTGLVDEVKRFTGKEPRLVGVSADHDPGTYEIWCFQALNNN
jgi:hypothetical protein